MRLVATVFRPLLALATASVVFGSMGRAAAQELPRASAARKLNVVGIVPSPRQEDLLGLSRVKFQGLIAGELESVGYQVASGEDLARHRAAGRPALSLTGMVKDTTCDDDEPRQCRVSIQWELQDSKGIVLYRVVTRAVDASPERQRQQRALLGGALHSLLTRRKFALQLTDVEAAKPRSNQALGFKQCRRPNLGLPQAARALAASLVLVESGSKLARGSIISPDGFILTSASELTLDAPLRVRLSAQQTVSASLVAVNHDADVALLRVDAHFDTTCVPVRDTPLTAGRAAFGVSSEISEESATSLTGGVVQQGFSRQSVALLQIDARIARGSGAPVLDEDGHLAGVVSSHFSPSSGASAFAVDVGAALAALAVTPAAITDPRLFDVESGPAPAVSYVRDSDDPPFVLGRRYTYGTSKTAHQLRKVGLITSGVGAFTVLATWALAQRSTLTPAGHDRLILLNDLSWAVLGAGLVTFGGSFALPESHDLVEVRTAAEPRWYVGFGPTGVALGGKI